MRLWIPCFNYFECRNYVVKKLSSGTGTDFNICWATCSTMPLLYIPHAYFGKNKYVGIKNTLFCWALGKKKPNQQTTKTKLRAVILHFVNSSKRSQTFLGCPDDVKENLLKRGSFVAVFLKNIPLLMQFHFTVALGFFF